MAAVELLQTAGSLALLLAAGWLFLRSTILRDFDDRRHNLLVQLLFAAVFALSANLLQLLICEILGMMDPRWACSCCLCRFCTCRRGPVWPIEPGEVVAHRAPARHRGAAASQAGPAIVIVPLLG